MIKQNPTTKRYLIIVNVILLMMALPRLSYSFQCTSQLYDNLALTDPKETFSVREKVYIKIACNELPQTDLNISVSWYNPLGELFRSDSQEFTTKQGDSRMIYFWIRLLKKGPLSSAYTDKLYSDKSYGQWKVESYITDKTNNDTTKIVSKQFTLQ